MPGTIVTLIGELTGFYKWFAIICFVIGLAGWYYLELVKRKPRNRRFKFAIIVLLSYVIGATLYTLGTLAYRLATAPPHAFAKDVSGIPVLRIEGDTESNDLQRQLVSSLNEELARQAPGQDMEVHACMDLVTESMGLTHAHELARNFGKKCRAPFVIWGNEVGEKKFHPRITVIESPRTRKIAAERTLDVLDITDLELPTELVTQPVYLAQFVAGYLSYERSKYAEALGYFEAMIGRGEIDHVELSEVRFYLGNCHWYLAQGQTTMAEHLAKAIAAYEAALRVYTERDFPVQWAITQNNLGTAYGDLPTGDRGGNLRRAIGCFEAALRISTERDFPVQWAATQNNLGVTYAHLPTRDRGENLRRAIGCFEAALRVSTERNFPAQWAATQNNLGNAYRDFPMGDRGENLQRAVAYYEAALRVFTEQDFPVQWAETQNNLGVAYRSLPTGDRGENLRKAIACYEAALRVRTERDFPADWGRTQINLGVAYRSLPTGDRGENLRRAVACYQAALRVFTEQDSPAQWAMTQNNLGTVYADLPTGDRGENLLRAIACYQAALRVRTERNLPAEWAGTQNNLGTAYADLPTGDRAENLRKAIACFENALTVFTETEFPHYRSGTAANLARAREQLQELGEK